jgi:hypothetical protein
MKRKLILFALLTMLWPVLSHAQVTAATCNESDVSKAWASMTSSTTTFTIPSGSCSWTSTLSLTVPSGSTKLTIQGSTTISTSCGTPPTYSTACTATDNTVIVDNCTSCGSGPLWQIITGAASSYLRITGLTVKGGSGGPEYNGMLALAGYSQNVRVDHNHFNSAAYSPANSSAELVFSGWLYGVADHNVFDSSTNSEGGANNGIGVTMGNYGNSSLGQGDGSWAAATNFGTGNFIFMENNTINYGYANDCGDGGRYVFRYNYLTGVIESQSHPTGGGGRTRGCRATEVYGNVFASGTTQCNGPSNSCQAFMRLSGGASLLWGNSEVTSGSYQNGLLFEEMRNGLSYGQTATPDGWGYCGTNYDGTGSNWDQKSNTATGYSCLDQGARGQGDLLIGGFTADGTGSNNVENQNTGCLSSSACAYPRQAWEPVYEWLDKLANTPVSAYNGSPSSVPYFVQNVDYFQNSNPGSGTNCTGFTGATGVGCGLLSARPSSCTAGPAATSPYQSYVPGVGYWATDTNTLYVCSATNTWTAYYTPYTYPHPLVQGQTSGNPPAAPTNLAATVN